MGQGSLRTVLVIPGDQPVTTPPPGMSFCVKGPADLLSVPSSSKVQMKISISGECGAMGGAGVSGPSQLGEPVTGHLLPKHTSAPQVPRAAHMGNKLWGASSSYLHELDHVPLSAEIPFWLALIHHPISAQGPPLPGSLPGTNCPPCLFYTPLSRPHLAAIAPGCNQGSAFPSLEKQGRFLPNRAQAARPSYAED